MAGLNGFVPDSFALIGFLEDEKFASRIEILLKRARQGKILLYLHAMHLGEVYYITLREQGQNIAEDRTIQMTETNKIKAPFLKND